MNEQKVAIRLIAYLAMVASTLACGGSIDDRGRAPLEAPIDVPEHVVFDGAETTTAPPPSSPAAATTTPAVRHLPRKPPDKVSVSWNEKSSRAEYALDLVTVDGKMSGPCIGPETLGRSTSYVFDGYCMSSNVHVMLADIRAFRVCWAENDDWSKAACVGVIYDQTATVLIHN